MCHGSLTVPNVWLNHVFRRLAYPPFNVIAIEAVKRA